MPDRFRDCAVLNWRLGPAAKGQDENMSSIQERIDAIDWIAAEESLSGRGYAVTPPILTPDECQAIIALYGEASRFRSHIIMERYRFGVGDYKYFDHPLPETVQHLRTSVYPHLAKVANQWA